MRLRRKNSFFTFLCSFIPGAAEMNMGFMKAGFSLMGIFFLISAALPQLFSSDSLLFIPITIWFYGFFHARNLATMDDMSFSNLGDHYIWEEFVSNSTFSTHNKAFRTWFPIILIVFGVCMLWNNLMDVVCRMIPDDMWDVLYPTIHRIPSVIVAVILITVGFTLIKGKKQDLNQTLMIEEKGDSNGTM